jgi:beta-glucanase (GH16 family)
LFFEQHNFNNLKQLKMNLHICRPIFIISLIILLISCNLQKDRHVQTKKNYKANNDSLLNLNSWKRVSTLSDEFDKNNLDTKKWKKGLWYDVSGDFAFKDDNTSVKDGNLQLTAKKESFNGKEFTIGAVESKFDMPSQPSLVRVRAKLLSDSANVCSAIWLQSWPEVKNNPNPEIDIIEHFFKTEMHMNLFTWGKDNSGKYEHVDYQGQVFDYKIDLSKDYHVYGLERINGNLRFYFDDKLVYEWKSPNPAFSNMPRHIILSLEGHRAKPNLNLLPASFLIDYVRVYDKK